MAAVLVGSDIVGNIHLGLIFVAHSNQSFTFISPSLMFSITTNQMASFIF